MEEIKYGIAWKESYNIGYDHIDSQHRSLFGLLSDLVIACMDGNNTEKLKNAIDFLIDYTVKHFQDEEDVQIQWSYPGYENHKKLHEDFKVTVTDIVQRYNENGSSSELSNELNRVVIKWIISHIQKEDKKIGDYIRDKQRI